MPLTVDATVGGVNSNSFQTVAEIDTYFLARVPSSVAAQWNALTTAEKSAAAVMATTWITALVHWTQYPTSTTQALPWPQTNQLKRNGQDYIANNVIPQELKNCHAEVALYLAVEDRIVQFDPIELGIQKIKAGSVDIQFREKIPVQNQPSIIPSTYWDLLVPSWIDHIEDVSSGIREVIRA
jgi:hypothetical protein